MPRNFISKLCHVPNPSRLTTRALLCALWAGLTACAALARQAAPSAPKTAPAPPTSAVSSPVAPLTFSLAPYSPERKKFWSFQPVKNPALPAVKNLAWCKTPIDRFILAGLEAKGLKPALPADRRTLIRRATFDLTGLPPTPEETEAFAEDKAPDAWPRVVDRLLASPRYGERQARRWLDIVRYADSYDARGLGGEGDISEAWRYRDWVVNAFNRDLPYNQFMKYQVAGDLLDAQEEKGERKKEKGPDGVGAFSSCEGTIATGLLAIGNWGNGDADKEKILTDIADDQLDVVSRSMMGLTVACARCHDHKFDPIPTKDYYGLAGIFFSSHILPRLAAKGAGENPLRIPLLTRADQEQRDCHAQQMAEAMALLTQERQARLGANAARLLPHTLEYIAAARQYEQRSASQAGVTVEAFARSQGLQGWALRQWRDALGLTAYARLSQRSENVAGQKGVTAWRGSEDCPNLLVNTNISPRVLSTLTLPPQSVSVHPGPQSGVVVAWRSPITGRVRVSGRVADADANGGDGIAWAINLHDAYGRRELASGAFPDGGTQDFANGKNAGALTSVSVRAGERIELVVLPKANYNNDTTTVELTIVAQSGQGSDTPRSPSASAVQIADAPPSANVWNLTRDLTDAVSKGNPGNPWPDGYGHPAVWTCEDTGDDPRLFAPPLPNLPDNTFQYAAAQWQQAIYAIQDSAAPLPITDAAYAQAAQSFVTTFRLTDARSPFWIRRELDENALPDPDHAALALRRASLSALQNNTPPPIAYANGIQEGGVPDSPHAGIHDVRVHIRGSYARLGDVVPRHFPVVLAGETQPPITQGSGTPAAGRMAGKPRPPAHRSRVGQSRMAGPLRAGPGSHTGQLRTARRTPLTPEVAGLAGVSLCGGGRGGEGETRGRGAKETGRRDRQRAYFSPSPTRPLLPPPCIGLPKNCTASFCCPPRISRAARPAWTPSRPIPTIGWWGA